MKPWHPHMDRHVAPSSTHAGRLLAWMNISQPDHGCRDVVGLALLVEAQALTVKHAPVSVTAARLPDLEAWLYQP